MRGLKLISNLMSDDNLFSNNDKKYTRRIEIDEPLWDQKTYYGRWRYYAFIIDMRTIFVSEKKLREAKRLCDLYKAGEEPEGTTESDVKWAKKLRDSYFDRETGEPLNFISRLSFQLPGNIFLTTGMLTYYKTTRSMILWQILNQAFNVAVNYAYSNSTDGILYDTETLKQAFISGTFASCTVAIGFNHFFASRGPPIAKWSAFFAVAAGNAVNLPIIRKSEIKNGIFIFHHDPARTEVIKSKIAAIKAITECTLCRIIMAAPGMLLTPVLMKKIKGLEFYKKRSWIGSLVEAILVKCFLLCMIPSALAIYGETHSLNTSLLKLSPSEYKEFKDTFKDRPARLSYNKGL